MTASPSPAELFVATGLNLRFGSQVVWRDVSLRVRSGELWCLLGPNGHGKTTLLHSLLGIGPPVQGTLERRGLARRPEACGFVPQRHSLRRTMPVTLGEFVELGFVGLKDRLSCREREARLEDALRFVGLDVQVKRSLWALSGGQRQRALLARAWVRRPEILLADEPTSHLDSLAERAIFEGIQEARQRRGMTAIVITHSLPLAQRFATHVAWVHHQRVEAGPKEQMIEPSRVEKVFDHVLPPALIGGER